MLANDYPVFHRRAVPHLTQGTIGKHGKFWFEPNWINILTVISGCMLYEDNLLKVGVICQGGVGYSKHIMARCHNVLLEHLNIIIHCNLRCVDVADINCWSSNDKVREFILLLSF